MEVVMSALSAIETPVAKAREPRGAVTAEFGRRERPIRVVAGPLRSTADQDREVAISDGQARSSSILVTGIQPSAGPCTGSRAIRATAAAGEPAPGPGVRQTRQRSATTGASSPPVLAGVVVGPPRATARPAYGAPGTALRLTRRGRIVLAALVLVGATLAALLITLLAS